MSENSTYSMIQLLSQDVLNICLKFPTGARSIDSVKSKRKEEELEEWLGYEKWIQAQIDQYSTRIEHHQNNNSRNEKESLEETIKKLKIEYFQLLENKMIKERNQKYFLFFFFLIISSLISKKKKKK